MDILKFSQPEELFQEANIHNDYRQLAKQYHPDRGGDAAIFAHITALYRKGLEKIQSHSWRMQCVTILINNRQYKIHYKKQYTLSIGEVYICHKNLVFVCKEEYKDLVEKYYNILPLFTFEDDDMREEFSSLIPKVLYYSPPFLVIKKDPALVRLRDVMNYYNGQLDPRSTAWIVGCLYNIACFYRSNSYISGDISLDSIYIHPAFHQCFLSSYFFGSFGEAKKKKFTVLPQATIDCCSYLERGDFLRDFRVDGDLIKSVGEELSVSFTPAPMREWFQFPSSGDIYEEYKIWMNEIIPASFGERKFFNMTTSANVIYNRSEI